MPIPTDQQPHNWHLCPEVSCRGAFATRKFEQGCSQATHDNLRAEHGAIPIEVIGTHANADQHSGRVFKRRRRWHR